MHNHGLSPYILLAEDDEDDRVLLQAAVDESDLPIAMVMVEDGESLLDYLRGRGTYAAQQGQPLPALVLLDLNMPRKDGHEALQEIRRSPALRHLPVIVLSTTQQQEEVQRMYSAGANAFITKPTTFEELVHIVQMIYVFWFQVAQLPLAAPPG